MNKYEEEKAKIIADHIRREGTKPLDKAEKFMLWFLDQEKKLAQKNNESH